MGTNRLRIAFLGGCGQFGLNCTGFDLGDRVLVIDCGAMFPSEDMPGVDLVLPNLDYLRENSGRICAYLLTHGHEDHIGAMPFALEVAPAPVYGTPFTLELLRHKLQDYGTRPEVEFVPIEPGRTFPLGEYLRVTPVAMAHSIPQNVAYLLDTRAGRILHASDFKMEAMGTPTDWATDRGALTAIGDEGLDLLLADSTNALVPGRTPSEDVVTCALSEIFATAPGRLYVASFASHIARIQALLDLCAEHRRQLLIDGRAVQKTTQIARDLGLLHLPPGVFVQDHSVLNSAPRKHTVVLMSGSQAEPRSSLSRLALGDHSHFQVEPGDTVILSARVIPGRERHVARLVDRLCRLGATVEDLDRGHQVHVSGHGFQADLRELLELVRPRYFMPIHGRFRMQLAHGELARRSGVEGVLVPNTGSAYVLGPEGIRYDGRVPAGQVFVEGLEWDEVGLPELRDRRALAHTGLVVAVLLMDSESRTIAREPELIGRGLVSAANEMDLLAEAKREVQAAIDRLAHGALAEPDEVSQVVRTTLRRYFRRHFAKAPVVLPLVVDI